MATGLVTGYQHELIDMKDFTKENFIEFCDKYFYHLSYFEITKEEFDQRKQKRIDDAMESLRRAEAERAEKEKFTDDDWQAEYNLYVIETEEDNIQYRADYEEEIARFRLIEEYASQISPHLDYIWKELKEPELYQAKILPFDEWKEAKIWHRQHMVEFYQKKMDEINSEEHKENNDKVKAYEEAKKKFLEG